MRITEGIAFYWHYSPDGEFINEWNLNMVIARSSSKSIEKQEM